MSERDQKVERTHSQTPHSIWTIPNISIDIIINKNIYLYSTSYYIEVEQNRWKGEKAETIDRNSSCTMHILILFCYVLCSGKHTKWNGHGILYTFCASSVLAPVFDKNKNTHLGGSWSRTLWECSKNWVHEFDLASNLMITIIYNLRNCDIIRMSNRNGSIIRLDADHCRVE